MAVKSLKKSLSPPKAGESLKKPALAKPKAVPQVLKKFDAAKDIETWNFFFFTSVLVWLVNKVWCQLHSEKFRSRAVLL